MHTVSVSPWLLTDDPPPWRFSTPFRRLTRTQIHLNAATFLPRHTGNVILFFAWGLKHMIAGMVLFSATVGLVVMTAAVALSVPMWVALAGYPVVCSLTLTLAATLSALRPTRAPQTVQMLHPQA